MFWTKRWLGAATISESLTVLGCTAVLGCIAALGCTALLGCTAPEASSDGADMDAPPQTEVLGVQADGKFDDFYSPQATEFALTTRLEFTHRRDSYLTPIQHAEQLSDRLTRAIDDAIWEEWTDSDARRGDQSWLLRTTSPSESSIQTIEEDVSESRLAFDYRVLAAGPADLAARFPLIHEAGQTFLDVETYADAYRLTVVPLTEIDDAYPEYDALFENGLQIAIFIGDDAETDHRDLHQAQSIHDYLMESGFDAPSDFSSLAMDASTYVKDVVYDGRRVAVNISLYFPDLAGDHPELLADAFRAHASSSDVVIYHGHAGTTLTHSGVSLHYEPRVAIAASEFQHLNLPESDQVFFFAGCNTYTGYADMIYAHPNKDSSNADVITTANFTSYRDEANSARGFLRALLGEHQGQIWPSTWRNILNAVHEEDAGGPWVGMYGVHGLDDNPRRSPTASSEHYGERCFYDARCGGVDSLCLWAGLRFTCGMACAADAGCPTGSRCLEVRNPSLTGSLRQCVSGG